MRDRAVRAAELADVVVLVQDCTDVRPPPDVRFDQVVYTKLDLAERPADGLTVSVRTGANLDALRALLDALAFGETAATGAGAALALNARHVEAITDARAALRRATALPVPHGPELVALELREALDALGRILGAVTPDDVIGRIFATFCIGK